MLNEVLGMPAIIGNFLSILMVEIAAPYQYDNQYNIDENDLEKPMFLISLLKPYTFRSVITSSTMPVSVNIYRQVLGTISVSLASLLWGFSISWSAVALPQLRQEGGSRNSSSAVLFSGMLVVDDSAASWIGSSMPVGGTVGSLISGTCIDLFGRKKFMLLLYLTCAIGWCLVSWAPSVLVLCIGKCV